MQARYPKKGQSAPLSSARATRARQSKILAAILEGRDTMRTAQQLSSDRLAARQPLNAWKRAVITFGALWFAIFVAACGSTTGTPSPTATTAPTATNTPGAQTFKVFFPHHPQSDSDPTAVFALERPSPIGKDQPFYALQELFKGPTTDERNNGYYSPFDGAMGLISYCSGDFKDFTLSMDHRGNTAEAGTATLTFCRTVAPPGEMAGARMESMIKATLLQFAEIKKVIILNHDGNCFNDLRGDNQCLSH
jgi:hypothetical protein